METGIIFVEFKPNSYVTESDVIAIINVRKKLYTSDPQLVLASSVNVKHTTQKAREAYKSPDLDEMTKGLALLVKGPLSRFFGNYYIKVKPPDFPTKMFTDQDKAIEWLRSL